MNDYARMKEYLRREGWVGTDWGWFHLYLDMEAVPLEKAFLMQCDWKHHKENPDAPSPEYYNRVLH